MSKFLRWVVAFLYLFVMRMRNWHLDTGLKLFLKISPILVFDPPLLGHCCIITKVEDRKRELAIFLKTNLVQCLGASFAFT